MREVPIDQQLHLCPVEPAGGVACLWIYHLNATDNYEGG